METIVSQFLNYAQIETVNNFCCIEKKQYEKRTKLGIYMYPKRNNRTTNYIHHDEYNVIPFPIDKSFITDNDEIIKNYYADPFTQISIHTIQRKITCDGDKLSIKLYKKIKFRDYNKIYFKCSYSSDTITVNLKNGDIYITHIEKQPNKKETKTIRRNTLQKIKIFINTTKIFAYKPQHEIYNHLFDNSEINNKIKKIFGITDKKINISDGNQFLEIIIKNFIKCKEIKLPNNFDLYAFILFYPTKKFLKKNDNKFIQSLLDKHGYKSKSINKFLNVNPNINIENLLVICKFFGKNFSHYITKINPAALSYSCSPYISSTDYSAIDGLMRYNIDYDLSDEENKNLFDILNKLVKINSIDLQYIHDHINMLKKLNEYGNKVKLKAKNWSQLQDEHIILSTELVKIQKKHHTIKVYDKRLLNLFNQTDTFSYVLLKSEIEYNEEGAYMHHCVASYIANIHSIIISIRDKNCNDRVTCEIDVRTGKIIQAKYYCNQEPPEKFMKPIEYLSKLVTSNLSILKLPIKNEFVENKTGFVQELIF